MTPAIQTAASRAVWIALVATGPLGGLYLPLWVVTFWPTMDPRTYCETLFFSCSAGLHPLNVIAVSGGIWLPLALAWAYFDRTHRTVLRVGLLAAAFGLGLVIFGLLWSALSSS